MEQDVINVAGLDRAEILQALYNAAKPQGLGFLHFDPEPMSLGEAQIAVNVGGNAAGDYSADPEFYNRIRGGKKYFDYFKGRVMKVEINFDSDEMFVGLYNRDNGPGAAQRALAPLLERSSQQA